MHFTMWYGTGILATSTSLFISHENQEISLHFQALMVPLKNRTQSQIRSLNKQDGVVKLLEAMTHNLEVLGSRALSDHGHGCHSPE